MPATIPLKKPLETHDGAKSSLVLRDPIGGDYVALGKLPFSVKTEGEVREMVPDFKATMAWLSRLSGIDDIILGRLSRADFLSASGVLNGHLVLEGDEMGNSAA